MYEIITEWLTEDMTALLGSYTQPVVASLVVGLGLCACLFFCRMVIELINSAFGGRD